VLTREWLKSIGIPPATTRDAHALPHGGRGYWRPPFRARFLGAKVVDAVFPPSLAAGVARKPDLVVPSTEHLVRYKEGDLLGFLLKPRRGPAAANEVGAHWADNGPPVGAGTGKSTVCAVPREGGFLSVLGPQGNERLLFTTYTRAPS